MRAHFVRNAALLVFLALITLAAAQTGEHRRTVVINGHPGELVVYQIDGRSFVDLESLMRIANGTVSFQQNQIVLTIPTAQQGNPPAMAANTSAASPAPASESLSPGFQKSAIQTLAATKNWTDTLAYAAQNGVPGNGSRLVTFHDRAYEALGLAKVEASSPSDQNAFHLLANHVNNVQGWNNTLVAQRQNMNTGQYSMTPNAMANDPTYQRITACAKFLGMMISSGQFQNDGSCQ